MADQFLDPIRDALDGPIDFEGQRLAEQLSTNSLAVIGLLSFLIGYITQDIRYTVFSMGAGTLAAFIAIVPAWPMFNQSPLQWLPSQSELAGLTITMSK